jgi:hypothetical protein
MPTYRANDDFNGALRSTWIASPADTTLAVNAIPANVPTIITVGYKTTYQTAFSVTGTSGTNSGNYTLTGVTRLKGANANIPENTPINCLNHEEFFNQYEDLFGRFSDMVDTSGLELAQIATPANPASGKNKMYPKPDNQWYFLNSAGSEVRVGTVRSNTTVSSATPAINSDTTDIFTITALATAITSMTTNLTGTPGNGQKLVIRIKDDGTARAITWGASFASRGATLPTITVAGKYQYNGFFWNSTASTWDCVATVNEA